MHLQGSQAAATISTAQQPGAATIKECNMEFCNHCTHTPCVCCGTTHNCNIDSIYIGPMYAAGDGVKAAVQPPRQKPQVVAARLSSSTLEAARAVLEQAAPAGEASCSAGAVEDLIAAHSALQGSRTDCEPSQETGGTSSGSGVNMNPLYRPAIEGIKLRLLPCAKKEKQPLQQQSAVGQQLEQQQKQQPVQQHPALAMGPTAQLEYAGQAGECLKAQKPRRSRVGQ